MPKFQPFLNYDSLAQAFCAAEPDAVVLVTCTEVCSVHINKYSTDRSEILGNIIFGDGATSAILSAGKKGDWQVNTPKLDLGASILTP